MSFTGYTWFFLITVIITTLLSVAFTIILFNNFRKKRTAGTALLAITYLLITLAELANTLGLWLDAFGATTRPVRGSIQILFMSFYLTSLVTFYYFSNRHILKDNDILKMLVSIFGGQLVAVGSAIMFYDMYAGEPDFFVNNLDMTGINIERFVPETWLALTMLLPLLFVILLRIAIRLLVLQKRIKDKVTRVGIKYIFWSVVCITLTFVAASAFTFDFILVSPIALSFFHGLRMSLSITALLLGYLGWIMPSWLKKRIRGKTWIAKMAEKTTQEKIKVFPHAASKNLDKKHRIPEEEVSDT